MDGMKRETKQIDGHRIQTNQRRIERKEPGKEEREQVPGWIMTMPMGRERRQALSAWTKRRAR